MGILADIFIATAEQANEYELQVRSSGGNRFRPLQLKGITDIEFGILWALLEQQEWNVERHLLDEISFDEDTSLFEFQSDFLHLLKNIPDFDDIAKRWAATEELKESNWSLDATLELVKNLNDLSKQAIDDAKGLYLWVSL